MPLPLPNLDDRGWADLIEEARSLIPYYAPQWTDHNEHDPGITLLELFAWLAEMDMYQLNRIPEKHRRKFLALAGLVPHPPQPAQAILSLSPLSNKESLDLPVFLEFQGKNSFGEKVTFQTLRRACISSAELRAIQLLDGTGFREIKKENDAWPLFAAFGQMPEHSAALYLGFSKDLSKSRAADLYFKISGPRRDDSERRRIIAEIQAWAAYYENRSFQELEPPREEMLLDTLDNKIAAPLKHHSAQTVWEFLTDDAGEEKWESISDQRGELFDDTRAFTLDGCVSLIIPKTMKSLRIGKVNEPLFYVRCRFSDGDFDAVPFIQTVIMNAIPTVQKCSVGSWELSIAPSAHIAGVIAHAGELTRIRLAVDEHSIVQQLLFEPEARDLPEVFVLAYQPPDPQKRTAGVIILELEVLGKGNNRPLQTCYLDNRPVVYDDYKLFSLERGDLLEHGVWNYNWREWQVQPDFDASSRVDSHFTLDPTDGEIIFGNGQQGRVPPNDCLIIARFQATIGDAGNLEAGQIDQVSGSLHNRALLGNDPIFKIGDDYIEQLEKDNIPLSIRKRIATFDKEYSSETELLNDLKKVMDREQLDQYSWLILKHTNLIIGRILNPLPAFAGASAESLTHAQGRAVQLASQTDRAVTAADIERLVRQTPGTELSRVAVRSNLWNSLSCVKAPGNVTVIVVPYLPANRPVPSTGLLNLVKCYLNRRRPIGMRFHVIGPAFRKVTIEANVRAFPDRDKSVLQAAITDALCSFFDPLHGGPEANGWPFGRNVFRSEVLQIIDQVDGVDYVESLSLIADDGEPQCGNISLCPDELVVMGTHKIEVM